MALTGHRTAWWLHPVNIMGPGVGLTHGYFLIEILGHLVTEFTEYMVQSICNKNQCQNEYPLFGDK